MSAAALAVAARNARAHGVAERITFVRTDLLDALAPRRGFDVIVSNPPYLTAGLGAPPELAFEPCTALAAGADGLSIMRRLIAAAPQRLRAGGRLVMELGGGQDSPVRALAAAAGFADVAVEPDLAGIPRALVARWVGRTAGVRE
jgi:release factor glutamine methyltransferase